MKKGKKISGRELETGLLKGSIGLIGTQIMDRIIFRYPCFIYEGNRKEDVRIIYLSRPEKCVLSLLVILITGM